MSALEENWAESSVKNALRANASKSSHAVCFQQNQREEVRSLGEQTGAIAANAGAHQTNYVCYAVRTRNTMANGWGVSEEAYTLDTSEGQAVAYSVDCRNMNLTKEHGTLQAKENGGQSLNYMGAVCYPIDSHQQDSRFKVCADGISPTLPGQRGTGGNNGPMLLETAKPPRKYIVRRLTPLECCRLQGFPDWWEDGVQGSDSARYKMWGNGIALPNAAYVIGCAKKLIQGKHQRPGHDGIKEQ